MSTKRKSAFSVYKSRQHAVNTTIKKETISSGGELADLDTCTSSEVDKTARNETKPVPNVHISKRKQSKKDAMKENVKGEIVVKEESRAKPFSRASRLRRSIGNIGINKKKRKSVHCKVRQVESQEAESSDSEEVVKKARTSESEVNGSSAGTLDSVQEQNEDGVESEVASLPRKTFDWLIGPVKPGKFFSDLWEKKPLLVKRHEPNFYEDIFSTKELDRILKENDIKYSVNLDVTTYENGKRETHNPPGRALAPVVWDFYQNGCSIRLLNPQTFSHAVWKLNATLQEYFGSFVGANAYLTPPNTQGFAPHYDDIEAFILQLEGKKHWRVYSARDENEVLPRLSSGNFSQDEIGEPILDITLEPGDLLYFPRGMIHQADTLDGPHSLHITLSTYQKTCWGDLMEKLIPRALQIAIAEDVEFRHGLPVGYLNSMGIVNSESTNDKRSEFLRHVEMLFKKLVSYLPVDGAVDQMGIRNIHDSLPPVITKEEKNCSIFDNGARWQDGQVINEVRMSETTSVRLVRKGAVRVVAEEDVIVLYYTLENSRTYHEQEDPQCIELTSVEALPIIEHIIKTFPKYEKVINLPGDDMNYKMDLVTVLYEKGILVTKQPLVPESGS